MALVGHCAVVRTVWAAASEDLHQVFSFFMSLIPFPLCCSVVSHKRAICIYVSVYIYAHIHQILFCLHAQGCWAELQSKRWPAAHWGFRQRKPKSSPIVRVFNCSLHSSLISRPVGTPVILLPEHLHITACGISSSVFCVTAINMWLNRNISLRTTSSLNLSFSYEKGPHRVRRKLISNIPNTHRTLGVLQLERLQVRDQLPCPTACIYNC